MKFEKWQALGNDYLILEREALPFELSPARVRRLCECHFGVGADGVLLLAPASDPGDVADLRIYNPDGSEAELSGNGAREAALYLRLRGWTERDEFTLRTPAGPVRPQITGPFSCRMDLGAAKLRSPDYPGGEPDGLGELELGAPTQGADAAGPEPLRWRFQHVSIGNPQCAIELQDPASLEGLDVGAAGPPIEAHHDFPNRTNVSWYAELEPPPRARIRARIFERGVGETLSSGTGASGAAVAYALTRGRDQRAGASPAQITVVLDGGELEVEVGEDLRVHLSGWALPVFAGSLSKQFVAELREL